MNSRVTAANLQAKIDADEIGFQMHEHSRDLKTGQVTTRSTYRFDVDGVTRQVVYDIGPDAKDVIPETLDAEAV